MLVRKDLFQEHFGEPQERVRTSATAALFEVEPLLAKGRAKLVEPGGVVVKLCKKRRRTERERPETPEQASLKIL